MEKTQEEVLEFHEAFDLPTKDVPTFPGVTAANRRIKLVLEETTELVDALLLGTLANIADAIGDLLYVTYGTAIECGMDMEPIMREIHRSNMTKVGGSVREDGKLVKPPTYEPPVLGPILRGQLSGEPWSGDTTL